MAKPRTLKPEYEELLIQFQRSYPFGGCSCHSHPPCGYCTDPGNPLNLEETDDAWMTEKEEEFDRYEYAMKILGNNASLV